jgi:hypothetical protein
MGEQKQRARHSKKMRSTTVTSMVVPREEGGGVHGGQKGEKPSVSVSKKHNEHYQLKNKGRKKLKNINNKKEKTTLCSQLCHKVTSMDCNFYENWLVFMKNSKIGGDMFYRFNENRSIKIEIFKKIKKLK